jgi:hypothetical protein
MGLHWTVHLLGVGGMFAMAIAIVRLVSHDLQQLDWILFDLIGGIGEVGLAAYLSLRPAAQEDQGTNRLP